MAKKITALSKQLGELLEREREKQEPIPATILEMREYDFEISISMLQLAEKIERGIVEMPDNPPKLLSWALAANAKVAADMAAELAARKATEEG